MKLFRYSLAVSALATISSLSGGARAQEVDEYGIYRAHERGAPVESPQHFALEIRFGRYVPNIDDEFSVATPYETTFGSKDRYVFGLELDYQFLRIPYVGTLGGGLSLGYTHFSAPAFIANGGGQRAGEDTGLMIIPMSLLGVLRADVLARSTPIPLVPYVKAGLGSAIWRITNGGGTAKVDGVAGSGISWGPQVALGGMLLLDFFDQDSAKNLDNELGINNSYFFFEWYVSKLGAGNQLEVGTNTWALGLAFEI
ncbi:MAG TPA: MXAN_2562 family outer membrane beta-barrel protein [Polyangiaceae bacterium]|nr:MXAN_2562 family outer membrane beta-barrel protein [Polyangiaceae bacterium]